jgi:hypothetical protein
VIVCLEKGEEYGFPEDSGYESECEFASGNAAVDREQRQGQGFLPVLKIGSLVT